MTDLIKRGRHLKNEDDVFNHNAWDDTEWTEDMCNEAERRLEEQRKTSSQPEKTIDKIEDETIEKWDSFYRAHGDKFFKDRKWLASEFNEIFDRLYEDSPPCHILEIGCGVGNAVVQIIDSNFNPNLHVFCCDISAHAIEVLEKRESFGVHRNRITAFQVDVCKEFETKLATAIPPNSIDFITLIFAMSAFKPDSMSQVLKNLSTLLRPGGLILFRDYARYDLTQLRFKGKSYLRDNYYVRADGTTSYFFTKQTVKELFEGAGLVEVELKTDNRMLVNRLKGIKMCRCWIQAKYTKA